MNQTQGNSMNGDTNILTETNLIESFDSESDGFYVLEMFSRSVNIRLSLRFSHTITSFPHYGRLRISFLSTPFCTGLGMLTIWDTSLLGTSSDLVSPIPVCGFSCSSDSPPVPLHKVKVPIWPFEIHTNHHDDDPNPRRSYYQVVHNYNLFTPTRVSVE